MKADLLDIILHENDWNAVHDIVLEKGILNCNGVDWSSFSNKLEETGPFRVNICLIRFKGNFKIHILSVEDKENSVEIAWAVKDFESLLYKIAHEVIGNYCSSLQIDESLILRLVVSQHTMKNDLLVVIVVVRIVHISVVPHIKRNRSLICWICIQEKREFTFYRQINVWKALNCVVLKQKDLA